MDLPAAGAIRSILQAWPKALADLCRDGNFPVHCAVSRGGSAEVIQLLLEHRPELLREVDRNGQTVLHRISDKTKVDAVRFVADAWPEAGTMRDHRGFVPLHVAAQLRSSGFGEENDVPDILRLLVERYSESAHERNNDGMLPIHLATSSDLDAGSVRILVQTWPGSVRERDPEGNLPLHRVKIRRPFEKFSRTTGRLPVYEAALAGKLDKVTFFVERWPESVRVATHEDGMLPIHLATSGKAHIHDVLQVAQFLVQQYPQALMIATTNDDGMLPLHLAASIDDTWELLGLIRFLVEQAPQAVRYATRQGLVPLQCAVRSGSAKDLPVVRLLLEAWPKSVRLRDLNGNSLLHLTVSAEDRAFEMFLDEVDPLQVVRHLLQLRPQLVRETHTAGSLPLHVAMASTSIHLLELVRFLVERQPSTLLKADAIGSLPLHVALAQPEMEMELVQFLVDRQPSTLLKADANGSLPLHMVMTQPDVYMELVQFLVESETTALLKADANGSLPLHVALAQEKVEMEIVHYLLEQQPLSLEKKDVRGRLPLHVAATNVAAPLDAVFLLVSKWPEAVYGGGRAERV